MPKRIVVGISGASGAAYSQRLIQLLVAEGIEVHLVVSPLGQRLLHDELGMEGVDLETLAGRSADNGGVPGDVPGRPGVPGVPGVTLYNWRDVGAAIASGAFLHDGMVIIPCSSNSLSAVATGSGQNLMHRAAHVTLKERRKLVLVHREMPLSMIDIRNMAAATEAGAIVCPANPGFYLLPQSIDDIVDFVVARVLDLLGIQHNLNVRWGEPSGGEPSGGEPSGGDVRCGDDGGSASQ